MAVLTPSQMQAEIQRKASAGVPLTNTGNAANNAAYKAATPAVQKVTAPVPSAAPKSTVAQAPQRVENAKATAPVTSTKNALYTPAAAPKAAVSSLTVPQSNVASAAVPQATAMTTPKTSVPTTNYVAQGGKTLNDILYLKDNYNASNKNYVASQANPLYAQLDPNTAAMVKGMSADQLRSYINGMGAKSPTSTAETSAETPIEEVVPKDYRSLATAAYERELAAMMAAAQSQETELNRRYEYANNIEQDNRQLETASFYRNNAPTAWDGSTGYQAAQNERNNTIEDHYTQEALTDATGAAYAQANAFRNQSGNYIESKAAELESAEKQYNLQVAGLTGVLNGQQTMQGAANAASTAGQLLNNQSQAIANQIAQIDLANYPETSQLQIKQLQQQVQSGKISNDAAAYQLTQLTDPNSTTNQAAALDLAMKSIDASNYSESAKLKLEELRKSVAEIGKIPYQSDADARLDQLKVLTAEAELQKLQETEAKAAGKTYEDYQSNIEKLAVRDTKTGALKNPDVVEEYIVNSDMSEYEMYRAYRANGLTWGGAVPSKGGVISPSATASGAKLNTSLGGSLKNTGDIFASVGAKYGIDPALLAAIAVHETGNGTSNAVKTKNNVGGMMGKNGLMTFDSIEEGIEKMASNLKRNYIDKGLTTIEQIQKKYAPNGAANDPNGLNDYWVKGVTTYYNKFSK